MPRGTSHAVRSREDLSLHITFSLQRLAAYDLVPTLLESVDTSVRLRETLEASLGDLAGDGAAWSAAVTELDQVWRSRAPSHLAWSLGLRSHAEVQETQIDLARQLNALVAFDSTMRLRRRQHLLWRIEVSDSGVEVQLREQRIRLPARQRRNLLYALSGNVVCAADSPDCEFAETPQLFATLLTEAVLVPTADRPRTAYQEDESR